MRGGAKKRTIAIRWRQEERTSKGKERNAHNASKNVPEMAVAIVAAPEECSKEEGAL